jgi:hypothetical protein
MVQMNAGSAIYGALVVQGQMKVNGTAAVIYDGNVIEASSNRADRCTRPCRARGPTASRTEEGAQ